MEQLPVMLSILTVGGLVLPVTSIVICYFNIFARAVYTTMYLWRGSNYRTLGALAGSMPYWGLAIAEVVMLLINL